MRTEFILDIQYLQIIIYLQITVAWSSVQNILPHGTGCCPRCLLFYGDCLFFKTTHYGGKSKERRAAISNERSLHLILRTVKCQTVIHFYNDDDLLTLTVRDEHQGFHISTYSPFRLVSVK